MKGSTKFLDYNGNVFKECSQPIPLDKDDLIEIESASHGPVLTTYFIENKVIKISMIGWVHYEYTVRPVSTPKKQEFFI